MQVWTAQPKPPAPIIAARWSGPLAEAAAAYHSDPNSASTLHSLLSAFEEADTPAFEAQLVARRERIAAMLDDLSTEFSELSEDLGLLEWCRQPNSCYRPKDLQINFGRKPLASSNAGRLLACLAEVAKSPTGCFSIVNRPPSGLIPAREGAALAASARAMRYEAGQPGVEGADLTGRVRAA